MEQVLHQQHLEFLQGSEVVAARVSDPEESDGKRCGEKSDAGGWSRSGEHGLSDHEEE